MEGAGDMKTLDGYVIKTVDPYPIKGKDPDDYNYPLVSKISPVLSYTSVIDP